MASPLPQVKRPSHTPVTLDATGASGQTPPMRIYKILRASEWADLQAQGETPGAPIDVADGFVHFSTAGQAQETAAKHFAGETGLILAALEADSLGDALKWEVSRGGDKFPHLYGPLRLADVIWHSPLPFENGTHIFPKDM